MEPAANTQSPWLITIAASAGGIEALRTVLAAIPRNVPAAIVVVQHRPAAADKPSYLNDILARVTDLPVVTADQDQPILPGKIYVARPDLHLTVTPDKRFSYVDGTRIRFVYSAANPLFVSAANVFTDHVIAVVLTGSGHDGTDGVQTVKTHGGRVIAQDPVSARHAGMPKSAVATGVVDYVLPLEAIAPALTAIMRGQPIEGVALN
jgi:two-component system, chemotaxis family, protein-glutamate methylesterase/glutaminase